MHNKRERDMKSVVRIMSIALASLFVMVSCNKDNVNYVDNGDDAKENIGYLSLANMQATVLEDTETVDSETRAGSVDVNDFDVVITNQAGETVAEFKYGERPSEPIALDGGVYKIAVSSADMLSAAWEAPVYYCEKEFIITRKQTTTINDLVCKLANIKVSVNYSADLQEQLDHDATTMSVALADSELEFGYSEERAGYFAPAAVENTLKLTFKCRYEGEDKDITMTSEIKGVKAAQWRKINVVVQHAADGTTNIGIACETWTYDEEVNFDTSMTLFEEVIPDDTDVPVITWEGHDLAETFELTDDMFDAEGNFKSSINLDVVAKSPIKSFVVKATSDNADFVKAYSEIMSLEENLCAPTTSAAILKMMGYPTDVKDATTARIKFAAQTDLLKSYEGTHSYEIIVIDENGAEGRVTLTIKYGQNVAPQIKWVGYDIDKQQTYVSGMTCDLDVIAPLTIADFQVKIISATLTPEELAGVGLAGEFSLVKDTKFFDSLRNLGFPVGDEVAGKSELQLSITNFLSVLKMLGAGEHNFEMTVTDAEGNVTTKTVMMRFE